MSHDPEFFHTTEPTLLHRRHRRRRQWQVFFISLATVLVVWVFLVLLVGGQLAAHAFDARDNLLAAQEHASYLEFAEASEAITSSGTSLEAARRSLNHLKVINIFPFFDGQLDHADTIFAASSEVIRSLHEILNIGRDVTQLAGLSSSYLHDSRLGWSRQLRLKICLPRQRKPSLSAWRHLRMILSFCKHRCTSRVKSLSSS